MKYTKIGNTVFQWTPTPIGSVVTLTANNGSVTTLVGAQNPMGVLNQIAGKTNQLRQNGVVNFVSSCTKRHRVYLHALKRANIPYVSNNMTVWIPMNGLSDPKNLWEGELPIHRAKDIQRIVPNIGMKEAKGHWEGFQHIGKHARLTRVKCDPDVNNNIEEIEFIFGFLDTDYIDSIFIYL